METNESLGLVGISPATNSYRELSSEEYIKSLASSKNQNLSIVPQSDDTFTPSLSNKSHYLSDDRINGSSVGISNNSFAIIDTHKSLHSTLEQSPNDHSKVLAPSPLDTSSHNQCLTTFHRDSDDRRNSFLPSFSRTSRSYTTSSHHLNSSATTVKKLQMSLSNLHLKPKKENHKNKPRSQRSAKGENYGSNFDLLKCVWSGKIPRLLHKATSNDFKIRNKLVSLHKQDYCLPTQIAMNSKMMPRRVNTIAQSLRGTNCTKGQIKANSVNSFVAPLPPLDFKIYVLMIQPTSRIFEIISIEYDPEICTIADLLNLIPTNCTDRSLGQVKYLGLCRPRENALPTQILTDLSMMASGTDRDGKSARILCGEILVAIPDDYTGEECQKISKMILKRPEIVELLSKPEPLKMTSSRKKPCQRSGGVLGIASNKCKSPRSVIPPVIEEMDNPEVG